MLSLSLYDFGDFVTEILFPKKSLLISFGSSSLLARAVLPKLKPFDINLFLSSKNGLIEMDDGSQNTVKINTNSIDDITSEFEGLLDTKRSELSEIVVVSFVGISDDQIFKNLTVDEINRIIDVNFRSNTYLASAVLKYFGVGSTSLTFISSTRALLGDRGLTMYSATKHALNGLVKGIALEYGRFGVRANVLSLGVAPVGLVDKVPAKRMVDIIKRSASGTMIDINSVVQSIEFLRANKDVNGSVLHCDGGYF